jgi:hypothetical protein
MPVAAVVGFQLLADGLAVARLCADLALKKQGKQT